MRTLYYLVAVLLVALSLAVAKLAYLQARTAWELEAYKNSYEALQRTTAGKVNPAFKCEGIR